MTTIAVPHPASNATRTGQATQIEQSRAGAEVYAAVLVAQQCPRNVDAARTEMLEACRMTALAERASFRFSRGGTQVSGPSVHLARELARCWGNIQYGVAELRRDDANHQSELQAFAWDVQTNARAAAIFIVPHKRDKKDGPVAITDMRDIYESNANAGARRVRECILNVLPVWFVEEAKETCRQTLTDGGGEPLVKRVATAVERFGTMGITENQLAGKMGKARREWTPEDLATLTVIYRSIQRGEMAKDEEFPSTTPTVTAADITGPRATEVKEEPDKAPKADSKPAILDQINRWFDERKLTDDQVTYVAALAQRRTLGAMKDLTADEASAVLDQLPGIAAQDDPVTALQEIAAEWHDRPAGEAKP